MGTIRRSQKIEIEGQEVLAPRRFLPEEEHLRGLEYAGRWVFGNLATIMVKVFFDGTGNTCLPERPKNWSKSKWKKLVVSKWRAVLPTHDYKGFLIYNLNDGVLSGAIKLTPA